MSIPRVLPSAPSRAKDEPLEQKLKPGRRRVEEVWHRSLWDMTRRRPGTGKGTRSKAEPMRFVLARDVYSHSPDVPTQWLGDPEYRDPITLMPRRLRLRGRGPSLVKLIRRVWPTGDVDQIAAFLVESGSVRVTDSYYELESRFVPFRADAATALSHSLKTVRKYTDTVAHNMACAAPEETWVERSATNRHIPSRATPLVRRYLRRQVAALTARVDQYLRRLQVEPGTEDTVEISISAFAHSTEASWRSTNAALGSEANPQRASRRRNVERRK
jgi:hypothetical protein